MSASSLLMLVSASAVSTSTNSTLENVTKVMKRRERKRRSPRNVGWLDMRHSSKRRTQKRTWKDEGASPEREWAA